MAFSQDRLRCVFPRARAQLLAALAAAALLLMLFDAPSHGAAYDEAAFTGPAAQADEETELAGLINDLRANRGMEAYVVDAGLMAMAQEHSRYQASIRQSTHLHSDGRMPPDLGVVENVAVGELGYITPYDAVYSIWVKDSGHMRTLVGYTSGTMGVGVADDGETAYYTLEVRPAGMEVTPITPQNTSGEEVLPIAPLVTAAPQPDGTVIHVVGYGQTLWSIAIAYGVRVSQIRAWNNLPADSTNIYAGQKLRLVGIASPVPPTGTPAPTPVETATLPATAPPTSAVQAVAPQALAAPTLTAQPEPIIPSTGRAPGRSGLALPLIAAASILMGCFLLGLLATLKRAH